MLKVLTLLGTLVAVGAQYSMADFYKGKIALNDQNWNAEIKKHKYIVVEFMQPYCPYVKRYKPRFDEEARTMLQLNPPVPLGIVNIRENPSLHETQKITGTPNVYFYVNGKKAERVRGWGNGYMTRMVKYWIEQDKKNPSKYRNLPAAPIVNPNLYRTTGPFNKAYNDMALAQHNMYRKRHGVQMLRFDQNAAISAQKWAEKLNRERRMYHSRSNERPGCGENLAYHTNKRLIWTTNHASKAWYSEITRPGYNYNNPGYYQNPGAGHFTAMVWKDTSRLGCGISGIFVVCRYCGNAPNMLRRFKENVLRPAGCPSNQGVCTNSPAEEEAVEELEETAVDLVDDEEQVMETSPVELLGVHEDLAGDTGDSEVFQENGNNLAIGLAVAGFAFALSALGLTLYANKKAGKNEKKLTKENLIIQEEA